MFWFWFLLSLGGAVALFLLFLNLWGRTFRVSSHQVILPELPKEFDGYRIAVLSDLHDRRFGTGNARLISAVLDTAPDLVVTAGDLHEDPHSPEPVYALFRGISQTVPITYTEGNHDLRRGRCDVTEEDHLRHLDNLSKNGAILLNDTVFSVERNGKRILIYGQSWRGMLQGNLPEFVPDFPSIAVCHDPMQFDRLPNLPDLMISGHVHGGILRLPWIGPVFAPGNGAPLYKRFARRFFFPKYSRGLYFKKKHVLAVTQGLGFAILPIRFIRPEILVLTLKTDEKLNNS